MPGRAQISLESIFGLDIVRKYEIEEVMSSETDGVGLLGLPIYQNLEIQQVDYNGQTFGPITLLDVIITTSLPRNIVTTPVTGRSGTVKEFISNGDYVISIRGGLYSEGQLPPNDQLRDLRRLLELPLALPVSCTLLEVMGIYNIVPTSVSWPKVPGYINVQGFEIEALSDLPVELELKLEEE